MPSLYTYCILIVYSSYPHRILIVHSLYTHCTLIVHSLYTHCTLIVYSLHTDCILTHWRLQNIQNTPAELTTTSKHYVSSSGDLTYVPSNRSEIINE